MNNKVKLPPWVIMAGGRGVRLGAITKNTPKPILKIYNKPYLSYLIQWLSKNGFKKFIFLLSYKHQKIEIFLKEYFADKNLNYKIFIDKKRSGTFAALKNHLNKPQLIKLFWVAHRLVDLVVKVLIKVNKKQLWQKFLPIICIRNILIKQYLARKGHKII